ncbi:membrane-bound lytic murein transglycosylase D [Chitinivorax tropicus]|uniref:Membrane-bound lytic murein transglycosylase D n=1 Tax=Chitinivorax tropicus TaxID=714531 RepID=A0A840MRE6_9PROT|nr:LysM peptidoglycan-binding domain-containing protein [Chitinivorax tropicus]MBB5019659.1 membrane-bound lytic murein transglycosylase D [Chitinivorax tropicus]
MKKLPSHVLAIVAAGVFSTAMAAEPRVAPPPEAQLPSDERMEPEAPQADLKPAEADQPYSLQFSDELGESDLADTAPTLSNFADADLWDRIRHGFALNNLDTTQVRDLEQWYAARPEYLYRMADRAQRYLYHIVNELERRSMPLDLALLPVVESSFNPKAYSSAHASGIWQFIPSTGKNYGLEQTWWYDGRRDVLAATEAALDYLQYLYGLFGDWHLALAAYNWGEGAVARALAKNRAAGLPEDYQNIRMPAETQNYVPKLLAIRNLVANPARYGLKMRAIPNRPYFTAVNVPHHMDTKVAAKLANMPMDEFLSLNPAFNKPVIAYKPSRKLLLPAEKAEEFTSNLASYDKPLLSWKPYATSRGERFERIAAKFGTTVEKLREVNNIGQAKMARGEMLLVPSHNGEIDAVNTAAMTEAPTIPSLPTYAKLERVDTKPATHLVKRGETLFSIAKHYGMSPGELKSLNQLNTNHVAAGKVLVLEERRQAGKVIRASAARESSPKTRSTQYTVRRGDTIFSIARRFNVTVADLQRWNKAGKHLTPGDVLVIHLDNS